jgi:hypothetical protein
VSVAIRSVYDSQHDILDAIQHLHCPMGFECDATYGNGAFWSRLTKPRLRFDVTPVADGVEQADCRNLPLPDASLQNLVLDLPFLTYVTGGRGHKAGAVAMTARFGGYYTYGELEESYSAAITEAARVLAYRGVLVFKCQDIIHNHRMHCTHSRSIQMAEQSGFRLLDLFVLTAKHRMPGPQKGQQRHARIWHSYFLVFERNKSAQ